MARHISGGTIWAWQSIMGDIGVVSDSRSSCPRKRASSTPCRRGGRTTLISSGGGYWIVRLRGALQPRHNSLWSLLTTPPPGARHRALALHEERLERHVVGRAEIVGLVPHPADAIAQPALQRAEALPFEA